jgi:hypothetical protein
MLWIFDETAGQAGLRVFTDVLVSLIRQWTFHSSAWRIASGALLSCLLLTGWWHLQQAALAAALRRGDPGALEEIKHRFSKPIPWPSVPEGGSRVAAMETADRRARPDTGPCDVADGVPGIVAAFRDHPVVMIGEVHWLRPAGEFYVRLVRDRKFQETAEDIVVEFASRNLRASREQT